MRSTGLSSYSVAQHSVIVRDLLEDRGASPDERLAELRRGQEIEDRS